MSSRSYLSPAQAETAPAAWGKTLSGISSSDAVPDDEVRDFLRYCPEIREDLPPVWEFPQSDDGRAAFFRQHFGEHIRFVPEHNEWRIWLPDSGRWKTDNTGRLPNFLQILSRKMLLRIPGGQGVLIDQMAEQTRLGDALKLPEGESPLSPATIKRICRDWERKAAALGDETIIAACLKAASRASEVIELAEAWDADPMLLGVKNGVIDLRTREHRQGRPGDLVTASVATDFVPGADCPQWRAFIDRVIPDREVSTYIQKIIGYVLTGLTDDQAFYFLYGNGRNGKSIFIATIAALLGSYGGKARNNLIEESRNGADCKHDLAQLPGVRFLHGEEARQGGRLREDVIKSLVAGDVVTGEKKYQAPFSFRPVAKLFLMGNCKPRITRTDDGIWRRVRLIPFTTQITEAEMVAPSILLERFRAEFPGILNWALEGLAMLAPGQIPMPDVIASAVAEYRQGEDDLGDFLEDCTATLPHSKVSKGDVFAAYRNWAEDNGIRLTLSQKQLSRQLKDRPGWIMDPRRESWIGKVLK